MQLFFGLIAFALLFGVVCRAPLAWDGSWYLFNILNSQSPYIPVGRVFTIPLHYPVVLASTLTSDLRILGMVFGLAYVAVPMTALAVSWWIVRPYAPSLFLWAALGLGVGTLPGQLLFASEGIQAVQLSWPIILSVLIGIRARHVPVLLLFVILVFSAHPVAGPLLALAAGFAFFLGLRRGAPRQWLWSWSAGLLAMASLKFATSLLFPSGYEAGEMSLAMQERHFRSAVAGLPLKALVLAWLGGISVLLLPVVAGSAPVRDRIIRTASLMCVVGAGSLLILWARDPDRWKYALDFRSWTLFSSLPFMIFAGVESFTPRARLESSEETEWKHRLKLVQAVAVVFAIVFCVQSTAWYGLTNRLREAIDENRRGCVSKASFPWLAHSALNHWSISSYAILLQGRMPRLFIAADSRQCAEVGSSRAVLVTPWDYRPKTGGWFDLSAL